MVGNFVGDAIMCGLAKCSKETQDEYSNADWSLVHRSLDLGMTLRIRTDKHKEELYLPDYLDFANEITWSQAIYDNISAYFQLKDIKIPPFDWRPNESIPEDHYTNNLR